ncbi:MAG: MGMT family protein [Patescibacteria group bacterium]|nr:MGMT family protein [Patescibacteria group bacterium]
MPTSFARSVYQAVQKIPRGKVSTYARVAASSGHPGAARAVGNALHRNPTPGPVPCHRVVKSRGDIGGYVNGRQKKLQLLKAEGVKVDRQGRVARKIILIP